MRLGRDRVKKNHIYAIEDQVPRREVNPSPDQYEKDKSFGFTGIKYSIPGRNKRTGLRVDQTHDYYLTAQKKLPGPGSYEAAELVGSKIINSKMGSGRRFSVPQASDRFLAPTEKLKAPAPDTYTPMQRLGEDVSSRQPKVPRTKFG